MAALNLTTLSLPHLPPNSHNVHIAVLKGIRNAEHIRSQLLAGNADYEYAFIDASNVCVSCALYWLSAGACVGGGESLRGLANVSEERVWMFMKGI